MEMQMNNMNKEVTQEEKYAADLDQALEVAGIGWYNLKYCLISAGILVASLVELLGNSIILPSAICDLQMTDKERGFIISIPYIGILLTSYPWGYLVDTRGRRKMLIYSCLGTGTFSMLAGLMPDTVSYSICKFLSYLCIACPSAAPYTFIAEMLPLKYRDIFLSVLNSAQLAGSALVPLLAWAILPLNFRIAFGTYVFRPWRLLNTVYAMFFIVLTILLICSPESPKFLVSQDKFDEALKVLQNMYARNKRKKSEQYPIKQLLAPPNDREKGSFLTSLKVQTVPLLKCAYLKWILLNGFLLFGVYTVLNGLSIWIPDLLNRVLTSGGQHNTACEVIFDRYNQTSHNAECNDTIDEMVLIINTAARFGCTVVAIVASASVKYIGKKNLIITSFLVIAFTCISINIITQDYLFAIVLSSTIMLGTTIGPVNAYAVEIFPTHLRGMVLSLSTMMGRIGSVFGAYVTGIMINNACGMMFYSFSGILFLCSALALLLPKSRSSPQKSQVPDDGTSYYITKM